MPNQGTIKDGWFLMKDLFRESKEYLGKRYWNGYAFSPANKWQGLMLLLSLFLFYCFIILSSCLEFRWDDLKNVCEVAQKCLTLCNPMDCSLPGSSVHGIFQARILESVAISFSRGSSRPRDWTWLSHTAGRLITIWAIGKPLRIYTTFIFELIMK